jgi:hypothetical protein
MVAALFVTLATLGLVFPIAPARSAHAEMINSSPSGDAPADVRQHVGKEFVQNYLVASGCEEASAAKLASALSPRELAFIAENPQILRQGGGIVITSVCGVLLAILFLVALFMETDTQEETGDK